MVLFDHWRARNLSLCLVTARPDARTYARAVREAYAEGVLKRGRDRVTWFGPKVRFADWPISEIFDVQRAFSSEETLRGLHGVYTCVFLSSDPQLEPVIAAYRAIWQEQMGPREAPTYLSAADPAAAERLLNVDGLAEAFGPLLRRAGLSPSQNPMLEGP